MLLILVMLLPLLFLSDTVRSLRGIRAVLVSVDRSNVRMAVAVELDSCIESKHRGQWEETRSWGWWRLWLSGCAMIATASIMEAQT